MEAQISRTRPTPRFGSRYGLPAGALGLAGGAAGAGATGAGTGAGATTAGAVGRGVGEGATALFAEGGDGWGTVTVLFAAGASGAVGGGATERGAAADGASAGSPREGGCVTGASTERTAVALGARVDSVGRGGALDEVAPTSGSGRASLRSSAAWSRCRLRKYAPARSASATPATQAHVGTAPDLLRGTGGASLERSVPSVLSGLSGSGVAARARSGADCRSGKPCWRARSARSFPALRPLREPLEPVRLAMLSL